MSELKEQQDRLSAMTAELTSLRHQSMWTEREGKIKMESVQREAEVLRAALAKKEEMVVVAEGKVEELQSNLQALKEESLSVVNELRQEMRKKDTFYSEQKSGQDSQIDELHKQTTELTREYDRARTDLREKQLEYESMKRELRGSFLQRKPLWTAPTLSHHLRNLIGMQQALEEQTQRRAKAEESRGALMRELELARGSKTDLVKEMMSQRDEATQESMRLQRQIADLNRRITGLQEEHLKVQNDRDRLQVENAAMEKTGISTSVLKKGKDQPTGLLSDDPIKAMRHLRTTLTARLEERREKRKHALLQSSEEALPSMSIKGERGGGLQASGADISKADALPTLSAGVESSSSSTSASNRTGMTMGHSESLPAIKGSSNGFADGAIRRPNVMEEFRHLDMSKTYNSSSSKSKDRNDLGGASVETILNTTSGDSKQFMQKTEDFLERRRRRDRDQQRGGKSVGTGMLPFLTNKGDGQSMPS